MFPDRSQQTSTGARSFCVLAIASRFLAIKKTASQAMGLDSCMVGTTLSGVSYPAIGVSRVLTLD